MTMIRRSMFLLILWPAVLGAQTGPRDPFSRGVPSGPPTATTLPLSLASAIERGLASNLAAVNGAEDVRSSAAARLQALSALVPHASATVRQSDQVLNTAAFGFSGFAGLPSLIGPFGVFDARLAVSSPLFDASALNAWRSERAREVAAEADYRHVREIVVLAVGNIYLQALADTARVATAQSQVETATALATLANDQNAAGLVARIDVVRQQVQLASARARQILAENQLAKRKLQLARAIGLPAGQAFDLTDRATFRPAPELTVDTAVAEALARRDDLKSAKARVDAARASRQSAAAGAYPSVHLDADVGVLGQTAGSAERTYSVAASLRVPIFEGGRTHANVQRADAELRQREADLADLTAGVRYDITAALLDLSASAAEVDVSANGESLAREALAQAQDRFRAGVASSIELVQAQDDLTRASEAYITSVYAHNLSKIELARALGEGETRFLTLVGGQP